MTTIARDTSAFLIFVTSIVGHVAAQTTAPNYLQPHAHIAPLVEGADPGRKADVIGKSSPRFNYPNLIWDNGEGFALPVDAGGYLGFDDGILGDGMVLANIIPKLTGAGVVSGWETEVVGADQFRHYIGNLVGSGQKPASIQDKAAFEIWGPAIFDPGLPTVLVITLHSTMGGGWGMNYPGDVTNHGLLGGHWPNSAEVALRSAPLSMNIFGAYITPPQGHNPVALYAHRAHQLIRAVELLLPSAYAGIGAISVPDPITTVVVGSSFGGYLSTILCTLFPNRFHGSFADQSSGSHQRLWGLHDSYDFMFNQMGWNSSSPGFDTIRQLQFNMGVHQSGTSLMLASFAEKWHAGIAAMDLQIERPHYFIFSDEDNVSAGGTEWLNLIRDPGNTDPFGELLIPTSTQTEGHVSFGVRDNNCHTQERKGFTLWNGGAPVFSGAGEPGVFLALDHLIEEVVSNVGGIMPSGVPLAPTPPTLVDEPNNTTMTLPAGWVEDPFDPVLARPLNRPNTTPVHTVVPTDQEIINLAPGFPKNGHGLALGAMVISDSGGAIFVGSGDGIVTKFHIDQSPPYSFIADSSSVELGQNISDLALTSDGNHLVVSTYRALYLLNTSDLTVFKQTDAGYNSSWQHTGPRSLVVAELTSSSPGEEIVYATTHGGLFVRSFDLSNEILNFPEPGIIDIVIPDQAVTLLSQPGPFPEPPVSYLLDKPIYFMSTRGHIAAVELGVPEDPEDPVFARLRAVSPLQSSLRAIGLSLASWDAADGGLTAYYDGEESFRFFDLDRLNTSGSIGSIGFGDEVPSPQLKGRGRIDFAVCDFAGNNYAVVIRQGWIYLLLPDGTIIGEKSLLSFGPAIDAIRVEVAEVVAASPGDEIVISTQAGHVVWIGFFQLWEETSPDPDLPITRSPTIPFPQTNESVAGGWAMDPVPLNGQIHFADQTGAHWAMDHDGTPHYRSNIVSAANSNYSSPIMDMGHAGTTAGLEPQAWTTEPTLNTFQTQPNEFTRNSFTVFITPGQEPGQEDPSWSSVVSATRTRRTPPNLRNDQEWLDTPLELALDENFWVFKKGGDVTRIGSPRITMQWGVPWPNHLSRVDYNIDSFGVGTVVYDEPSGDTGIWGSGGEMGSVSGLPEWGW